MPEWLLQKDTEAQITVKNNSFFLKGQNIYIPRGAVSSVRQLKSVNPSKRG